jgi:hypothetical protein
MFLTKIVLSLTLFSLTTLYALEPSLTDLRITAGSGGQQQMQASSKEKPVGSFMYIPAFLFERINLGAILLDEKIGGHAQAEFGISSSAPRIRMLDGSLDAVWLPGKGLFVRHIDASLVRGHISTQEPILFFNAFGARFISVEHDNFLNFNRTFFIPLSLVFDTRFNKKEEKAYLTAEVAYIPPSFGNESLNNGAYKENKDRTLRTKFNAGIKILGSRYSLLKFVDLDYQFNGTFSGINSQRHQLRITPYFSNTDYDIVGKVDGLDDQGEQTMETEMLLHGPVDYREFTPVFGPSLSVGTELVSTGIQNNFMMLDFSMNF